MTTTDRVTGTDYDHIEGRSKTRWRSLRWTKWEPYPCLIDGLIHRALMHDLNDLIEMSSTRAYRCQWRRRES